jgi:hypothetical protein
MLTPAELAMLAQATSAGAAAERLPPPTFSKQPGHRQPQSSQWPKPPAKRLTQRPVHEQAQQLSVNTKPKPGTTWDGVSPIPGMNGWQSAQERLKAAAAAAPGAHSCLFVSVPCSLVS